MSTYENAGYTDYYYLGSQLVAKYRDPGAQSDNPGYTGHAEDNDLQLTFMQQRYYDPLIGRFYSNDPVGFTANNPMMFNRYAYANNNPYKYTDPDGRNPVGRNIPYIEQARAQINQSRALVKATSIGFGPALGARLGVKTPSATAFLGAEASMIVQNGPNGPENLVTLAAGASVESGSFNANAQLFKIEETSDSSSGVSKTTSLKTEGPDFSLSLSSGPATISTDNTVEVQATVVFFKATVTVDLNKIKEELK